MSNPVEAISLQPHEATSFFYSAMGIKSGRQAAKYKMPRGTTTLLLWGSHRTERHWDVVRRVKPPEIHSCSDSITRKDANIVNLSPRQPKTRLTGIQQRNRFI